MKSVKLNKLFTGLFTALTLVAVAAPAGAQTKPFNTRDLVLEGAFGLVIGGGAGFSEQGSGATPAGGSAGSALQMRLSGLMPFMNFNLAGLSTDLQYGAGLEYIQQSATVDGDTTYLDSDFLQKTGPAGTIDADYLAVPLLFEWGAKIGINSDLKVRPHLALGIEPAFGLSGSYAIDGAAATVDYGPYLSTFHFSGIVALGAGLHTKFGRFILEMRWKPEITSNGDNTLESRYQFARPVRIIHNGHGYSPISLSIGYRYILGDI